MWEHRRNTFICVNARIENVQSNRKRVGTSKYRQGYRFVMEYICIHKKHTGKYDVELNSYIHIQTKVYYCEAYIQAQMYLWRARVVKPIRENGTVKLWRLDAFS